MIIDRVKRTREEDGAQVLTANVAFESETSQTFEVYFRFTNAPKVILDRADPFVIGFLAAAMTLGEDLEVRGPVDSELISQIESEIMPLLHRWFPALQFVELRAPERISPPAWPAGRSHVSTFSAGLDSMYTAARNRSRLDYVLAVHGFDIFMFRPRLWQVVLDRIEASAEVFGLPVLKVETNLRIVSQFEMIRTRKGRFDPEIYRIGPNGPIGAFLAAVGRCMEPFCSDFSIASALPYEKTKPLGTHPLLDPKWSTSAQRVLHDGCEAGRIEKLAWLKREAPETLNTLRVCHHAPDKSLNCSRCEKCLRTMCEARLGGLEETDIPFTWPIDLDRIKRLNPSDRQRPFWELIAEAAQREGEAEIADAALIALDQRLHLPRLWRRWLEPRRDTSSARAHWKRVRRRMDPSIRRGRTRDESQRTSST